MPGARVLKQRSHGERLYNFAKNRNPSIIQRFSEGETIPRQGGCNISRRSHFVCCERQRYNPAFGHGLAKGHNCAEQIPVRRRACLSKAFFNQKLARRAVHFRFETAFQAFFRAGPPASKKPRDSAASAPTKPANAKITPIKKPVAIFASYLAGFFIALAVC